MSTVKKQESPQTEGTEPTEAPTAQTGGIEDKLNALFKAVSELQAAVRDLAGALSASAEAQRGLKEALLGDLETVKSVLQELKKVITVGYPAVTAENKREDEAPSPKKKPEAVGEEVSAPPANLQPPHPVFEKGGRVEVVKTERPGVEVKKANTESPVADMVREVLTGKLTGASLVKKLKEVFG